MFEIVEDEEKKDLEFYPPQNAFEEQIQWTKEGKLWTFPIDNEAGIRGIILGYDGKINNKTWLPVIIV